MAQPFSDHPYLTGHHQPMRFEAHAPDLIVEGELPNDLHGVFYRTGSEPLYDPPEGYHWFDGDGMVYGFFFEDGRVSMRNKWVRTEKFEAELAAGKRLFGVFGDPSTTDPSVQGVRYNTGNTNIILHNGKLMAVMEGCPAIEMDPRSLDTREYLDYGGTITGPFSAHPTVDLTTGEMMSYGWMINGPGGKPEIRYEVIDKNGQITKQFTFEAPYMSMVHTALVTENWVLVPFNPLEVSLDRAMKGGPMQAWVKGRNSRFALFPRHGSADDIRWLEMPGRHMFHELNAWEEDGKLIADVAAANGTALFPNDDGTQSTHAGTALELRRWTIDLTGKTNDIKEETLNDRDIQFPRPDDRMMTRKTRHGYANLNLNSVDGRVDGMDGVIHFDTKSGKEDIYHFGDGAGCGELVFSPKLGSTDEADGYAMSLVHPANSNTTELAIFQAQDVAAGPIARVIIPYRIPSGFHCNYYSADGSLAEPIFA
ncbi:MAG: carotenoid oxygenase family protein [Erythrobacter sp.]